MFYRLTIRRAFLATTVAYVALFAPSSSVAQNGQLPAPASDTEFQQPSNEKVELGRMLFFDKVLSGNRDISCATCHSPLIATVDGLSTNIGTGGTGLSVLRDAGDDPDSPFAPKSRGARNMTPLYNLGHEQFQTLFWDGRIQVNNEGEFDTPAGANLPEGFDSLLAALSVFAQTDVQEMLGQDGTNELADAATDEDPHVLVWNGLIDRLGAIPEYVNLFTAAFPEVDGNPKNMTIVQVGNAIGAFQADTFRSDNSPFDKWLRGDHRAMSESAERGARLFYGKAECSVCHSGVFQTDHNFHAIGVPQVGPGFGDGEGGYEDFGREGFTGDPEDRYRFRTPTLRNVALTGPWGHSGAFNSLRGIVEHYLDPETSLRNYDSSQIVMPPRADLDEIDLLAVNDPAVTDAIADAIEVVPLKNGLSERDIDDLIEFLHALTDPTAGDLRKSVPMRVPSGLPLAETN